MELLPDVTIATRSRQSVSIVIVTDNRRLKLTSPGATIPNANQSNQFGALQPLPYVSDDVLMKRIDVLGRRGGMPLDILKNKTT